MKKTYTYIILCGVFLPMIMIHAATTTATETLPARKALAPTIQAIQKSAADARNAVKGDIQELKTETRQEIKDNREAFQAEKADLLKKLPENPQEIMKILEDRRLTLQNSITSSSAALKAAIETKRTEVEKIVNEKKIAIQEKISQFKDEKKKTAIENVGNSLNQVNKNTTDKFLNSIDVLQKAVVNITTRADKAEASKKDVSAVRAALEKANQTLGDASVVISAQAGKVYTLTITSEASAAADMKKSRDALQADLKVVQEKVQAARDAVWIALGELQKIPRVNDEVKPVVAPATSTQ